MIYKFEKIMHFQIDLPLNSGSLDKDVTQGDEGDGKS